jgi:dihydrofolate reductase
MQCGTFFRIYVEVELAIIVATDEQGLIGKNNDLPWKLSADLQYFRRVTMGKPLIMGRNTHESIGRPLPGRQNIIVTKNPDYKVDGCTVVHSTKEAFQACSDAEEAMVMGGASLYEQLLPQAEKLYLTLVHASLEGDTWFPDWNKADWREVNSEYHHADDKNDYPYSFIVYERV